MNIKERVDLLVKLGHYLQSHEEGLKQAKEKAQQQNAWFTQEFITLALKNIYHYFLNKHLLEAWIKHYDLPENNPEPKRIGIVMAGNIPLVGFHDFLCVFISGHTAVIKPSSKDSVLILHIVQKLTEWNAQVKSSVTFAENLKNCDAYIATGSNNSGRYFEYYFGKYPNIIRKNRTSVAILSGKESEHELSLLADDIQQYFGMGCRNVTKLFVPPDYDFINLLEALDKYNYLADFSKFKNNYDYQLALLILNNKFYMANESVILAENESVFSPVSEVHYEFYNDINQLEENLRNNESVQCIVGRNHIPFGKAQQPSLTDYADGADTMQFLKHL